MADLTYTKLTFDDLQGWPDDDHQAAFDVFVQTCRLIPQADWQSLCAIAENGPEPRQFFEDNFYPVMITDGNPMLFTGYFEPELPGARKQQAAYPHPIFAVPDDLVPGTPYYTRRQIEQDGVLAGRGLELAWLADPVDLYFLQVQGSGRITLPDGSMMRVGYGGKNGHSYTSVGRVLMEEGIFDAQSVSATAIRDWVAENPDEGRALLWRNESYVFFREVSEVPADQGPLGTLNRSITAGRSIAVDPQVITLGAPVWIEKAGADPMHRLMIAQDTGSAIMGAQRADIFLGTGDAAGRAAGRIKDGGRIIALLPRALADRLTAVSS